MCTGVLPQGYPASLSSKSFWVCKLPQVWGEAMTVFIIQIRLLFTWPRISLLIRTSKNLVGFISISPLGTLWPTSQYHGSVHVSLSPSLHWLCYLLWYPGSPCLRQLSATIRYLPPQDPITVIVVRFPSSETAVLPARSGLQRMIVELFKDSKTLLTGLFLIVMVKVMSSGSSQGGWVGLRG